MHIAQKNIEALKISKNTSSYKEVLSCCNDFTKCPKTDCETRKINPFSTMYDLVISKQQKSQKFA